MKQYVRLFVVGTIYSLTACSSLFDNPTVPDGFQSPDAYHSPTGGLHMTVYANELFISAISASIVDGGLLGDELANNENNDEPEIDQRYLPEGSSTLKTFGSYDILQRLRGQSSMARGILERFAPGLSPAIRGRLMILDGYARIFLADQYCSGVPLSTLDFNGDYTLKSGATVAETYESAVLMFDSALAISTDSSQLMILATLGKARAFIGAGRLKDASDLVASINTSDKYVLRASFFIGATHRFAKRATVVDRQGDTGLPYISSKDPRTESDEVMIGESVGASELKKFMYPVKYSPSDSFEYSLTSGVEARLIEAEYQLSQNNSEWLTILNTLRTDGSIARIDASRPEMPDTIWGAGTGGMEGLRLLVDPGTPAERIDMLFQERAAWLFLTGNRLPDMRRLVRNYGRDKDQVFPIGTYLYGRSILGEYGTNINLPIPWAERRNTLFKGCMNRDQ